MAKMNSTKWGDITNFSPVEFACKCGCESKHIEMDALLIVLMQNCRNHFGKPITVTSGYRCKKYNKSLANSIANSYHTKAKACDFYVKGITDTEQGRDKVYAWLKEQVGYKYAYYMHDGQNTWMGNCMHIEVK